MEAQPRGARVCVACGWMCVCDKFVICNVTLLVDNSASSLALCLFSAPGLVIAQAKGPSAQCVGPGERNQHTHNDHKGARNAKIFETTHPPNKL